MKTALIISGGDYCSLPVHSYDICIACDKGYLYAERLGIRPDVILGDFDSVERPSAQADIPLLTYPKEKDDTDTMLAIRYALGQGCDHILILCALGKRLDHTLANIQSMAFAAAHGAACEIISEEEHLLTLTGEGSMILPEKEGWSLSLFSLSDRCTGLSIFGAKYSVTDVIIESTFPIGCSNDWVGQNAEISLKSGILLIVESRLR